MDRDQRDHHRHLEGGLQLPERARGDHDPLPGAHSDPQHGDRELAGDDHHRHPRLQPAQRHEHDERRDDQQLVGDRVHQLAECRHRVARARQPPVDRVGQRRHREHDRGEQVSAAGLLEQRDDQHRHEQDPHDRQQIRDVQRDHRHGER